jgi:hypothetical protein
LGEPSTELTRPYLPRLPHVMEMVLKTCDAIGATKLFPIRVAPKEKERAFALVAFRAHRSRGSE